MKVFLLVMILIFSLQSLTKADDIKDYEIEGMSVGDSLLKFMNISQIEKAKENSTKYPNTNYIVIFYNQNTELYDEIQITYDLKDKNYLIHNITGAINYPDDYKECKKKKFNIVKEFKLIFINSEVDEDESPHFF